jgi:sirohydrochlorin ferrochelatase
MKTGILVLGNSGSDDSERDVLTRCCEYLGSKGHKGVHPAFHYGEPRSDTVMERMFNDEGIDTFCVLPLAVAEGNMTIWLMPKQIGIPDNSGSWRMVGEHDVAVRFATAFGAPERLVNAVADAAGRPRRGKGILVLFRGSRLSIARKVADAYAGCFRERGWDAACSDCVSPHSVEDAVEELSGDGCGSVLIVPLFIGAGGRAFREAVRRVDAMGIGYEVGRPLSDFPEFYEVLESKIPEGW